MKIIKDGEPIAELPDKPKNFDGWSKGGRGGIYSAEGGLRTWQ